MRITKLCIFLLPQGFGYGKRGIKYNTLIIKYQGIIF